MTSGSSVGAPRSSRRSGSWRAPFDGTTPVISMPSTKNSASTRSTSPTLASPVISEPATVPRGALAPAARHVHVPSSRELVELDVDPAGHGDVAPVKRPRGRGGRTTVVRLAAGPTVWAARPLGHAGRQGSARDVRQGGGFEHLAQRHPSGDPHVLELSGGPVVVDLLRRRAPCTLARAPRPPGSRPRPRSRRPDERASSRPPIPAGCPPGPTGGAPPGCVSRKRTGMSCAVATASAFIGTLGPLADAVRGQLDRGTHGVVDLRRDPHAIDPVRRRRPRRGWPPPWCAGARGARSGRARW